ncbi:MAG: diaminopimelate epimerase [Polyangiaceae bacterium]|nr:diaminopimelate epimerase [Polyangiaceae bacterium]
MRFSKYHGLGNDYLVMDPKVVGQDLTPAEIRLICHRNYGPGSDGVLWGPLPSEDGDFAVRIFNPDASEAEKSGNGLRIFCRYLFDRGLVTGDRFVVSTLGGAVACRVHPGGKLVDVAMGRVSFDSERIPVLGPRREVIQESITIDGRAYEYTAATIGNPHCVLLLDQISPELARAIGPAIETDPRFPNRTNVQFMKVLGRREIQIEIWERGAGYTLASGSSSSAAAAVARRLGLCDREIVVRMPGGSLAISVDDDFAVDMTGPVVHVADGEVRAEAFTTERIP